MFKETVSYRLTDTLNFKSLDRNMSKALSRSISRILLPADVWHEFYCCVDLTVFDSEAKLLIGRNGSLVTMKQYESLYHSLKDLTNGHSANSKLIDLYLAGFVLFLSFPSKGTAFRIFRILGKYADSRDHWRSKWKGMCIFAGAILALRWRHRG